MTTLMDIVIGCENHLGWQPDHKPGDPFWKARSVEVVKLRRAMTSGAPVRGVTPARLALALEYSRRKRLPIDSPLALLHRIEVALALANIPADVSDTAAAIAAAIGWERDHDDEQSLKWIYRLARANGAGRTELLREWSQAGRG